MSQPLQTNPAASSVRRNALHEKTTYYTRTQWWLGACLLLFIALFYLFTFRPATAQSEALQMRLNTTQAELDVARERARDLPRIAAENDALEMRLQSTKRLASGPEMAVFLRDIAKLGTTYSLRNFTYQCAAPTRGDAFSQLPIVLDFEGDMIGVYAFLKDVEELPRLTRLRSLSMRNTAAPTPQNAAADGVSASQAPGGYVSVQMALYTYFNGDSTNQQNASTPVMTTP